MSVKKPAVFVSSTCFDLGQVRSDLGSFIETQLGYVPLLSEHPSFPIDPDATTTENCRRRVEDEADILILIIGPRYGSLDAKTDKSVTNVEYLAARAKGIPIYAFIQRPVPAYLPVWAKNPTTDFSPVVLDNRVLAFAHSVKNDDSVWATDFDKAEEIVGCLRHQFAYLLAEGLQLRRAVRAQPLLARLSLRGEPFRLAAERPKGWEYKLFAQCLADGFEAERPCRMLHQNAITMAAGEVVVESAVWEWIHGMTSELERLVSGLKRLFEMGNKAFGAPGEAGSVADIVEAARGIVQLWKSVIAWANRVQSANLPKMYRPLAGEMSRWSDDAICELERWPAKMLEQISDALERVARGEHVEMTIVLPIRLSNEEGFNAEIAKLQSQLGLG